MASRRALTGGTGDVNPQIWKLSIAAGASTNVVQSTVSLPVQRLRNRNKSMVMEIIKLKYVLDYAQGTTDEFDVGISTVPLPVSASVPQMDATIIDLNRFRRVANVNTFTVEMTDAAGHGVLVATDKLNLFWRQSAAGVSGTANCYIYYRWKNVGMAEYVGIVQSMSN